MSDEKFCVNCKHVAGVDVDRSGEIVFTHGCRLFAKTNLVTGKPMFKLCEVLRIAGSECGPEGRLWELNPPGGKEGE